MIITGDESTTEYASERAQRKGEPKERPAASENSKNVRWWEKARIKRQWAPSIR
jgi:hypothetical protein